MELLIGIILGYTLSFKRNKSINKKIIYCVSPKYNKPPRKE